MSKPQDAPGKHGSPASPSDIAPRPPQEEFYSVAGAIVLVVGVILFVVYLYRREILLQLAAQDLQGAARFYDMFAILPFIACAAIAGGVTMLVKATKPRSRSTVTVEQATKQCPHCAETIKAMAKLCRYCGRDLSPTN